MDEWRIEALSKAHVRDRFECSKPSLDTFIRTLARQYEKRQVSRAYVAVRADDDQVFGYYTLSASSIEFEELRSQDATKLPRHSMPVLLIGRLAVDQTVQGKGLGSVLLTDAFKRCLTVSTHIGVYALLVHALDESAVGFYKRYGFIQFTTQALHLYLPMTAVVDSFESTDDE